MLPDRLTISPVESSLPAGFVFPERRARPRRERRLRVPRLLLAVFA